MTFATWRAFFFCKGPNSLVRELLSHLRALRLDESLIFLTGEEAVEEGEELKYLVKIVASLVGWDGGGIGKSLAAWFLAEAVDCLDDKRGCSHSVARFRFEILKTLSMDETFTRRWSFSLWHAGVLDFMFAARNFSNT